jgi:hypothetical protein
MTEQRQEPHPLRCETCDYGERAGLENGSFVYICSVQNGKWMPTTEDGNWLAVVGCASHSSRPVSAAPDICESSIGCEHVEYAREQAARAATLKILGGVRNELQGLLEPQVVNRIIESLRSKQAGEQE